MPCKNGNEMQLTQEISGIFVFIKILSLPNPFFLTAFVTYSLVSALIWKVISVTSIAKYMYLNIKAYFFPQI